MAVIQWTSDMLLGAFMRLLPRGKVWPRDPNSVMGQALSTLIPTYLRLCARDNYLLIDAFPTTTSELLPEWELSLGLPDPCAGESPSTASRLAQVVARFEAVGGQNIGYYVRFAATLGYSITITEYKPDANHDATYAHTWQVNVAGGNTAQILFEFGVDTFGEQFAYQENGVLECELRRIAPAHTRLIFNYSS